MMQVDVPRGFAKDLIRKLFGIAEVELNIDSTKYLHL